MNVDQEPVENRFESIRAYLSQFEGGAVLLTKNHETGVATLCLNRPEKRNAISGSMMVELRDRVEELERWTEGKAVIIHGEGNFCSGGDLTFAKASGESKRGSDMSIWMQDTLKRLQALPLVSVCLIAGSALGGGAEISVFCDFIIVADDAKYGFVHGKLGIVPAWGGGTRLTWRIGHRKALDLLLTSKILNARECIEVGLAECIVPTSEALTKTEDWLSERLKHHYSVVRTMKEVSYKASTTSYTESLNYEREKFAPLWGGDVNKEALSQNLKHVKK